MTELQLRELSILKEAIRVIEMLALNYYVVCGTALGAVKYQGYIPWDDDVDIALPRDDYQVFCERAQALLPTHLFLQNNRTDPQYPLIFSKVRDSNTTFIEKSMSHLNIHHGVYIDVFPLDGYPKDTANIEKLEKAKRIYLLSSLCNFSIYASRKVRVMVAFERLLGMHKNKSTSKRINNLEALVSSWRIDESDYWCNHGNWQGKLEYAPKEQYGEGAWATFEGMRVRIPENYDEYLTQKYGDWRADLPEDQQVGHHYYEICDLTRPYTEYIEHLPNGKIRLKKHNP